MTRSSSTTVGARGVSAASRRRPTSLERGGPCVATLAWFATPAIAPSTCALGLDSLLKEGKLEDAQTLLADLIKQSSADAVQYNMVHINTNGEATDRGGSDPVTARTSSHLWSDAFT